MNDLRLLKHFGDNYGIYLTEVRKINNRYPKISRNCYEIDKHLRVISLSLSGNKLTNVDFLGKLTSLTTLDLSGNQLTNVEFIAKLKRLTTLDLSDNYLTNVDFLGKLKRLTTLFLSGNNLMKVDYLKELTALTTLDLGDNQLINVDFLEELIALTRLDLSDNYLTNIDFLRRLTALTTLILRTNRVIEEMLSKEVVNDIHNPQRIINHYFKVKGGKPINEAKIIVVGEADYGKTLLVNRLVNDTYIDTKRTHGIFFSTWEDVEINNQKVKLNIWDFGGQEVMQNTHQYFFTERTIYILVLNARQNEASNKTKEHLERIKSVAKNSPIIVVGNKIDENKGEFDINRSDLRKDFNIKGFYGVCSNKNVKGENNIYDKYFEKFKNGLIAEIGNLDGIHKPFKEEWFEVKNHLESLKKNKQAFIKYHDYLAYCFDKQVKEKIDQEEIVTFLNELGIVVYLEKEKDKIHINVDDKLIFNPEWLISGVYAVIDNPQLLKRRAILDFDTFKEILDKCQNENYKYQTDDYKYVLKLMLACKLCVKMKYTENDYLIPDHLKEDKSEILKEYEIVLDNLEYKINFQYHYKELFEDIFRRFLIAMYDYVSNEYYWKTGVVLQYDRCTALVTADNSENKIKIKIAGGNARKRQQLWALIYEEFREIHKSYPNLDFTEWIAHKNYPNIIKEYEELISIEENIAVYSERKVYCKELERYENIEEFLDSVRFIELNELEREVSMKTKNVINNYGQMSIAQDTSTANQYNYANNNLELNKKLDEMFNKLNKRQAEEIEELTNRIIDLVDERLVKTNKLNEGQVKEFENIKINSDWKARAKLSFPIIPTILSIDFEKEFKFSEELNPTSFISFLRKVLQNKELQITNFNQIEQVETEKKQLKGEN